MTTSPAKCNVDLGLDNVWVNVDTGNLRGNARAVIEFLRQSDGKGPALMAVLKADGYGHGITNAALAFRDGGASWFGVTSIAEALELVESGIDSLATPILVFTPPITPTQCERALEVGLHLTVCDLGHLDVVANAASHLGIIAHIHLKVDTGMGRLGLTPDKAILVAKEIASQSSVRLSGVYTHFASAFDDDLTSTQKQLAQFNRFAGSLTEAGIGGFVLHCANSAALLRLPESRLDLVRAGTLLYGQYPSSNTKRVPGLRSDTLSLEARTVFVHDLAQGTAIGYGAEFTTVRPTRAAVIPVGFADGVTMQPASVTEGLRGLKSMASRLLKPRPLTVKYGSQFAPVLGRVAMQMIVVDVTDIAPPVKVGDVAVVPARRLAIRSGLPRIVQKNEAQL